MAEEAQWYLTCDNIFCMNVFLNELLSDQIHRIESNRMLSLASFFSPIFQDVIMSKKSIENTEFDFDRVWWMRRSESLWLTSVRFGEMYSFDKKRRHFYFKKNTDSTRISFFYRRLYEEIWLESFGFTSSSRDEHSSVKLSGKIK